MQVNDFNEFFKPKLTKLGYFTNYLFTLNKILLPKITFIQTKVINAFTRRGIAVKSLMAVAFVLNRKNSN